MLIFALILGYIIGAFLSAVTFIKTFDRLHNCEAEFGFIRFVLFALLSWIGLAITLLMSALDEYHNFGASRLKSYFDKFRNYVIEELKSQ